MRRLCPAPAVVRPVDAASRRYTAETPYGGQSGCEPRYDLHSRRHYILSRRQDGSRRARSAAPKVRPCGPQHDAPLMTRSRPCQASLRRPSCRPAWVGELSSPRGSGLPPRTPRRILRWGWSATPVGRCDSFEQPYCDNVADVGHQHSTRPCALLARSQPVFVRPLMPASTSIRVGVASAAVAAGTARLLPSSIPHPTPACAGGSPASGGSLHGGHRDSHSRHRRGGSCRTRLAGDTEEYEMD